MRLGSVVFELIEVPDDGADQAFFILVLMVRVPVRNADQQFTQDIMYSIIMSNPDSTRKIVILERMVVLDAEAEVDGFVARGPAFYDMIVI